MCNLLSFFPSWIGKEEGGNKVCQEIGRLDKASKCNWIIDFEKYCCMSKQGSWEEEAREADNDTWVGQSVFIEESQSHQKNIWTDEGTKCGT